MLRARHPGVLAAKVRDFGSNLLKWVKSAKVGQMGTKPAVGHLAPGALMSIRLYPAISGYIRL